MDLKYSDLVEVKALGVRFGQRGHIANRSIQGHPIYAVQFPDNAIAYFEESELEKIPPEEAATDREGDVGFEDIVERETGLESEKPFKQGRP